MQDHYEILGVRPGASKEEIEAAWRRAVNFWHPDRNKSKEAVARLKAANEARQVLLDDEERLRYDRTRGQGASMPHERMDPPSAQSASRTTSSQERQDRHASTDNGNASSHEQAKSHASAGGDRRYSFTSAGGASSDKRGPEAPWIDEEDSQPRTGGREWWRNLVRGIRPPDRDEQQVVTLFDRRPMLARLVLVPLGLMAIAIAALFTVLVA